MAPAPKPEPISPAHRAFGQAVKAAREAVGLSLGKLADQVYGDINRKGYISKIERGLQPVSQGTITTLTQELGLLDQDSAALRGQVLPPSDERTETDKATECLLGEVETLRDKLKLSEALAVALAYKYAEGNPTDIEGALKGLEAAFETAAEQKARDALPSNIDEAVDDVLKAVAEKNDAGELEEADALLMAEVEARAARIEREKAAQERLLDRAVKQSEMTGNAEAYAVRTLARIRLEAPSVADQYDRVHEEAHEKYKHGLRFGDRFSLPAAAALWAQCAEIGATPPERAAAQNNRALALQNQGTRTEGKRGANLLAQAVAAYDTALEVCTRQDHPVPWAMTQNNKGIALQNQGSRTEGARGANLLAQAVAAYDAALEVCTRHDHPVDWAMTQNNKGNALQNQGSRTEGARGAELFALAVAAYDAALEVRTRHDHPVDWATTQNNKGNALQYQGSRTEGARGADLLAQAVAAYDAALGVRTRQDHPVDWAMTQNNKGNALRNQGTRTEGARGAELFALAVAAYDAALEVRTRHDHPVDWAMTQNNKGNALQNQGSRTEGARGADLLAQAVAAYDAALGVRTRQDHPVDWAMTQENMALAKEAWAEHDSAPDPRALLTEALAHVDAALTVFDPEHMSYNHAKATRRRYSIRAKLDALP